ncbi:MAG: GNAT family N-acetyltransferase [Actinomycetota bacterium]|nr:GNAT family N-acetyltransferase [Actinomycetota bacterium]
MIVRRDPAPGLARAQAFEDALHEGLASRKEEFRWGTALFCPEVSSIYDVNFLRVDRPDDDLTVEALVDEADRVMAPHAFKHRKLVVPDAEVGTKLADDLRSRGWRVDRLLYMTHEREPQRVARADVDEVVQGVYVAARDEFNRREPYFGNDETVLRDMRKVARMTYAATDKRPFAAYVGDTIASMCELYSDGLTAQIEDVATLEEHRGKGLATAVVLRALHEAQAWGHETIFLVADDEDWPKHLYEKLGFHGVGISYHFLLKPEQ